MGKILLGVFCVAVVVGTVWVSDKQDKVIITAYSKCEAKYYEQAIPFEGREGFLSDCMN